MQRLFRSRGLGYAVAAGATAAAFLVRYALDPWLGGASPLLTFTLAVMAAAVTGGLFPGLLATALSAAAGSYFLGRDGVPGGTGEAVQLVVFSLVGGGVSYLCERMHAARRKSDTQRSVAEAERAKAGREVAERRRAEAALQAQKELLQTTLTSAGDGMIATDAAGAVTFLNPVAQSLTGWTQEDASGVPLTTVFRIVNEETRAEVENPALRALSDGRIVGLANHTVLISKDGTERPIDDSAAPIRAADGTVHGAVLVFRDITEKKRAERELRESERRHRTTLESITDAFFAMDPDWRFTYVNAEAERLLAVPRGGLLGRSHWEVYPDTLGTEIERSFRRAVAENVGVAFENYYAPHDRWYEVHAYPSPGGLAVYFRDVTDQRRAAEEAREHAAVVEALYRTGTALAAELDLGRIVQTVTDEGTNLTGAAFGAFFYNTVREDGEAYTLYTLSGVPREEFSKFPMPRATDLFGPTFRGEGVIRLDDVTADPRYGRNAPYRGMPEGHLPVRSYLAVSVKSRSGDVLGGLFFGHPETGRFTERHERLIVGIAAEAAVAIDNARLFEQVTRERAKAAANEDRLKLAVAISALGTFEIDLVTDAVRVNDEGRRIYGWSEAEPLTFAKVQGHFHPDDRDEVLRRVAAAFDPAGPGEFEVEHRIARTDGELRWLRVRGRAFFEGEGAERRAARCVGTYLDVTERKRADGELGERARLAALRADVSFCLASGDPLRDVLRRCAETLVRHLDAAFARVWTLDAAGDVLELQASAGLYTHLDGPHARVRVGEYKIGRIARDKRPLLTNAVRTDPNISDPAWASREGMVAFAGYPLVLEGRLVGVLGLFAGHALSDAVLDELAPLADGIAQFIDRKRSDERLRYQLDLTRAITDNATTAVFMTDAESRCTFMNPAAEAMTGFAFEEVKGGVLHDFIHHTRPDGRPYPVAECPIDRALPEHFEVRDHEDVFVRKSGGFFPVVCNARVIYENGTAVGTVIEVRDVTGERQAAEAVRRSEARKAAILDAALDCVITIDGEGRVVDFNPAAERTFGRSREEVLGAEMAAFVIPPALRDAHRRGIARYLATGEGPVLNRRVELTGLRADGTEFPVEAAITPISADPPLFTGHLRDITEPKAAEERLRESEARFRAMADGISQLAWMARPDGGRFWYNRRWYEYTGTTPEEMEGSGWEKVHDPAELPRVAAKWEAALASGEPWEDTFPLRRHDGQMRWHLTRARPERDEAGNVVLWFGTNTDIEDARRAEQKAAFLADASAHLSELLDYRSTMQKVAQSAVPAFADWIAVDLAAGDGTLQRVATTHADRAKERLARELAEKYPPRPDDLHGPARVFSTGDPELVPDVDASLPETLARDAEHLRLLKSLGFRSYMSVPLVTKGRPTGVMTFVTADSGRRYDASDLAVAEDLARRVSVAVENVGLYEALKEADQRKDEFLATLAHELRNPLAPIRMGLEVLRLGGDDPETVNEMLGTMDRQVGQMVRLIDDLLDVSRITRGKLDLRKTRVDLRDVAKTAVETVRPMVAEARHDLTVSMPEEPLLLDGDPARLSQVFSNLLNNAAKYTPEGGRIALTAERQGSDVVVSVTDTGLGIPEGMLERVFEMFAQIDRTLERSHGGLGIGLHLVRRLVELHGGRVEARSEGEGRGSEFVVRLPLVLIPTKAEFGVPTGRIGSGGRRVLVADDNKDAADMLARVLKALGHETRVVYDGQAAVEAAETFRPEVCLLDIGMPKLSGYDACRTIRAEPWGEKVFLVALTGWGAEEDRRRSKEAGFDRHLVKPVEPAELRELLADLSRTASS